MWKSSIFSNWNPAFSHMCPNELQTFSRNFTKLLEALKTVLIGIFLMSVLPARQWLDICDQVKIMQVERKYEMLITWFLIFLNWSQTLSSWIQSGTASSICLYEIALDWVRPLILVVWYLLFCQELARVFSERTQSTVWESFLIYSFKPNGSHRFQELASIVPVHYLLQTIKWWNSPLILHWPC